MSNKVTGLVVIFEGGEFAVPDVNEIEILDKATKTPLFNER